MSVELIFRPWTGSGPPRRYDTPPAPGTGDWTSAVFLLANESWNDYSFRTSFLAHILVDGGWQVIGYASIGFFGQETGDHTYSFLGRPERLTSLPPDYFSLGESLGYYETLRQRLGYEQAIEVLDSLNDLALDAERRDSARNEEVFRVSMTRTNTALEALEQAPALFGQSGSALTSAFTATVWVEGAFSPHVFDFDFEPTPVPSRINVLVGLNGTGKTQAMAVLARLLSRVYAPTEDATSSPAVDDPSSVSPRPSIYGVVAVSFSAFDDFVVPTEFTSERFKYVYCGLNSLRGTLGSRAEIVDSEVAARFLPLSVPERLRALTPLWPTLDHDVDWEEICRSGALPFSLLSAGQRIVLSISSELIRNVTNRVLVMMDEPEIHLHPQLLSGLLAWVDDLLRDHDSFAIVATHSPIVVQQALASSVFILRRAGTHANVSRPAIETFGANLTEIVREIFEDRLGDRNYQDSLKRLWRERGSVDAVRELFGGQLGLNAQIYLHSLESNEANRPNSN